MAETSHTQSKPMERTVYLRRRPLPFLKPIPGIRSLRLAQHWAIQVGEDGDIWELERLPEQKIKVKKGNLAEWEDAAQNWPKDTIGTTNSTDTEIASVGEFIIVLTPDI